MKTLELNLKRDVLIVDAEGLEITQGLIFNKFGNYNLSYYDYICKGSELTEEIASELVNSDDEYGVIMYQNYITTSMCYFDEQINALESFISAVESKGFYWLENPIKRIELKEWKGTDYTFGKYMIEFNKAEEKTFYNPLIFVKK